MSNDSSDILSCNVVTKFGSRTENGNRHRFVAFNYRGFPFLSNRVWRLQKKLKMLYFFF